MYANLIDMLTEKVSLTEIQPKLIGAMGLARRAGKLVIGAEMCEETIRAGKAEITFLAENMSENSEKKLTAALKATDSPYIRLSVTKEELAEKLGKKSFVVAAVITDKGFASIVYKALEIKK